MVIKLSKPLSYVLMASSAADVVFLAY